MVDKQFILNDDQERIVTAGVKFLRSDGAQEFSFTGPAGS